MERQAAKCIVLIATLDTKGPELAYAKQRVEQAGFETLVLDTGILGSDAPTLVPDFSSDEIAALGGEERAWLAAHSSEKGVRDRGVRAMAKGATEVLSRLYAEGRISGVLGLGGAQGTEICTTAMRALPLGVPKVMVSTVASGSTPFGIYVGTRDITMMHSVADILGINSLSKRILTNAAAAVVGMAQAWQPVQESRQSRVGITIYGTTTPGGLAIKRLLEQHGLEVVAFHPNGTGGMAMEELAGEGFFQGLFDLTTHEVTDQLFGGIHAAAPQRLLATGAKGIPRLVAPGSADFMTFAEREKVPLRFKDHPMLPHNPHITLVRTDAQQMVELAGEVARRLNQAAGPVAVVFPARGWSFYNRQGLVFYDPRADRRYLETLESQLAPHIKVHQVDAHLNDPEFAVQAVPLFLELMAQGSEAEA